MRGWTSSVKMTLRVTPRMIWKALQDKRAGKEAGIETLLQRFRENEKRENISAFEGVTR